jgi:hypothetical protein
MIRADVHHRSGSAHCKRTLAIGLGTHDARGRATMRERGIFELVVFDRFVSD